MPLLETIPVPMVWTLCSPPHLLPLFSSLWLNALPIQLLMDKHPSGQCRSLKKKLKPECIEGIMYLMDIETMYRFTKSFSSMIAFSYIHVIWT